MAGMGDGAQDLGGKESTNVSGETPRPQDESFGEELQVDLVAGAVSFENDVAVITSTAVYTSGNPGSPGYPDFDLNRASCILGKECTEQRDIPSVTHAALERAEELGFKQVEILTSEWDLTQVGHDPLGFLDYIRENQLSDIPERELDSHPLVRAWVPEDVQKAFVQQLAGVRSFLRANPQTDLLISFRMCQEEQQPTFAELLGAP